MNNIDIHQENVNSLAFITTEGARTSTQIIAKEINGSHEPVIKLTRKYQADLEEFGRVRFEIQPFETAGGTQKREIALLNEHQATLLMTYMKNTKVVRQFKKNLIKAFFELANHAKSQPTALSPRQLAMLVIEAEDAKALAIEEKNQAVKEKGQISESRHASLMGRWSQKKTIIDLDEASHKSIEEAKGFLKPMDMAPTARNILKKSRLPKDINKTLEELGYQSNSKRTQTEVISGKRVKFQQNWTPLLKAEGLYTEVMHYTRGDNGLIATVSIRWDKSIIDRLIEYYEAA